MGTTVGCEAEMVDDSMFELSKDAFLGQVLTWFVGDPTSMQMQAVGISQFTVQVESQILVLFAA
jgi:hypothetical protein